MLNNACPEPSTGTFDAKTDEPSLNVTEPAGTPALDVVVEVQVTVWPEPDGFGEQVNWVLVGVGVGPVVGATRT